jgi:uncharacterized protein (DUF302 family)
MWLYTYVKKSPFSFDETLDELRIAFAEEWFWVVSNVDISEKIKLKVDKNFPRYTTLWFCKPELAYEYISEDINLWIFMPCSISVYEKNKEVFISAWLPKNIIFPIIKNKNLEKLSLEISETMTQIIEKLYI